MKIYTKCRVCTCRFCNNRSSSAGFTLLELTIVMAMMGILAAIAAPSWSVFLANRRVEAAQDEVFQGMRDAQISAKRTRLKWQFSVKDANGVVQWANHPAGSLPTAAHWHTLDSNILIDDETTLQTAGGVERVQFDHEGNVSGQMGRLTLRTKLSDKSPKRCVMVSTLLGVLRKGYDRLTKENGKSCY